MRHDARSRLDQAAEVVFGPTVKLGIEIRTRYHVEHYAHFHPDGSRCVVPHDLCPLRHPRSQLLWVEDFDNIVVTAGLNRILLATIRGQLAALSTWEGRRLPVVWPVSTVVAVGDMVRPVTPGTNNRMFICEIAGTTAATEPVWPTTAGTTIVDNTVTWREASQWYVGLKGAGAVVLADTMASHAGWSELTPYSNATRPAYIPSVPAAGSSDNSASVAVFNINATATVAGALLVDLATKTVLTVGTLYGAGDFAASRSVASGDTMNITITSSVS